VLAKCAARTAAIRDYRVSPFCVFLLAGSLGLVEEVSAFALMLNYIWGLGMRQFKITTDIEPTKAREIGRFISLYSTIECALQQLLFKIAGISPAVGRLIIRDFRSTEYFEVVKKLKKISNISSIPDLSKIKKAVEELNEKRNNFAHGVWVIDPQTNIRLLRLERGSWEQIPSVDKVSRKHKPEAISVSLEDLKALNKKAESTYEKILKILS